MHNRDLENPVRLPREGDARAFIWSRFLLAGIMAATSALMVSFSSIFGWRLTYVLPFVAVIFGLSVLFTAELTSRNIVGRTRIALIGTPGVGKTVFITSLLDALQSADGAGLRFAPSTESINRVLNDMNGLRLGTWPARTPSDYLYLYSAKVAHQKISGLDRFFGQRISELEFADAAGEQIGEFIPGDDLWPNKTSYFKYALDSDVLFLFVDAQVIVGRSSVGSVPLSKQVNDLIFAIQSVCDARGAGPSQPLDLPIAIVVTKCDAIVPGEDCVIADTAWMVRDCAQQLRDYLMGENPHALPDSFGDNRDVMRISHSEMQRVLNVARARCRWVELFVVSAVGALDGNGIPVEPFCPVNVMQPIIWVLKLGRRFRS